MFDSGLEAHHTDTAKTVLIIH